MHVIKTYYPDYRDLVIHESSPSGRGVSTKLSRECENYSASHYFPDMELGKVNVARGFRNEDLERLTFADDSVDLFVTQDVMEHIFDPATAFREISRVLKPNGAHVFTVPLVNSGKPSVRWASMSGDGEIEFHFEPEYHGNPIDEAGSPVTMHWGYDIADFIMHAAGMSTTIVVIDDIDRGIRAQLIEVLISRKGVFSDSEI